MPMRGVVAISNFGFLRQARIVKSPWSNRKPYCLRVMPRACVNFPGPFASPTGEPFGNERLRSAIRMHAASATKLVHGTIDAVNSFAGQAEPHDDLTLLAATRTVG